jgi:pimeloyl-ACP methyl ester carboxylesterase
VIGGDQDLFFPAESYRETFAGISNAKLVLYKGLGHDAIMKRQFIEDVLAFLTADIA